MNKIVKTALTLLFIVAFCFFFNKWATRDRSQVNALVKSLSQSDPDFLQRFNQGAADIENTSKSMTDYISGIASDYIGVTVNKVTVNSDYSTDDAYDHIVLIDCTWDVKNSKTSTKSMLCMYSDDLAASIASDHPDVNEISIFWDVPYLNMSAKNSYTCSDGKAYISDVIY